MRIDQQTEDLLPTTEQKCIREEIAKRKLQTFSPLRREFYVSPSDAGTLPRSPHNHHHEPIYQTHEVFHHAHPCIGSTYAIPVVGQQPLPQQPHQHHQPKCQQSPASSHYAISSRKCSQVSSNRYQTPHVKATDSIKSFSSQQSWFSYILVLVENYCIDKALTRV